MSPEHLQDQTYATAQSNPNDFWMRHSKNLTWHKEPSSACLQSTRTVANTNITHPSWTWFPDGELSTSYNCIERHVKAGRGDQDAIFWDSPVSESKERITYAQLFEEVETLAGVLREEGVRKGDIVLIYMPMIPAAIYAMLATVHLGAIHAVIFGGFASAALAQRIEASRPRIILTASCGIEGGKGPLGYKKPIEEALQKSAWKPEKTIIWQRRELLWKSLDERKGQREWQALVTNAKQKGMKAKAVPVKSEDGLYIIYTSGTTGLPKGVIRSAGGHAVSLNFVVKYLFGIHGPEDVIFTASDIGWVVGTSFTVYAPLLIGAASVLYEGKPIGTPDAGAFWRIVEEYKVTTMFTAPTALRAIRKADAANKLFEQVYGKRGGLKSLKALFLAGERSEPSLVNMYQKLLEKHCARGAQVVDNWWSSESGSPITGIALSPSAGLDFTSLHRYSPLPTKPGSAGKIMPGFDVRIVDDQGTEVKRGQMGNIVLGMPLAPSAFTTLFQDDARFYNSYLKRFSGRWVDTGDAGLMDEDGYLSVMSRADDVINVAAHRFSTGAIEQAITMHSQIVEAAVIGIPDALKGHLPFAFITLSTVQHPTSAIPTDQLVQQVQALVREQIGSIAKLGGLIQGQGMIPKTRSGKTLRRVLRELVENATHGEFDKALEIPSTIEDRDVVDVARQKIREYFESRKGLHRAIEERAKL